MLGTVLTRERVSGRKLGAPESLGSGRKIDSILYY